MRLRNYSKTNQNTALRLSAYWSCLVLCFFHLSAHGQSIYPNRPFGYFRSELELLELQNESRVSYSRHKTVGESATVSVDVLRHPLSAKARALIKKAIQKADREDHAGAIQSLRETLSREPSSAPYVKTFLGVEYLREGQFSEARSSFQEVARLMPSDSGSHSNLAVSLALTGDLDSAKSETLRAIQLDPLNSKAKAFLRWLRDAR